MLRQIVICQCVLLVVGSVSECTRPIINHWLDDESLRNESFTLFGDHPAHEKTIFFTLADGTCKTRQGGKTRLFCNGYTFSLNCSPGPPQMKTHEILIGLGQSSVIWNHYKRMILTEDSITFGDADLPFDEDNGMKLRCSSNTLNKNLCTHENGEIIYGQDRDVESTRIVLFSDSLTTTVSPGVYSTIISGDKSFHYSSSTDDDVIKCGENCIWTSDIWKETSHMITRGDQNVLVLGTLARQQVKISYDAVEHYVHIVPIVHSSKYSKIASQIILIVKLGVLCFLATTTSIKTYNKNTAKFITTISVFIGLEILLFAHSVIFKITGLGQVALLMALHLMYDDKYEMGGQPQAVILALVLIQSTLIELSFFELSILALMAHGIIVISTFIRLIINRADQLALLFGGIVLISLILTMDVLASDIVEFKCLFGLSSSALLYIFFTEICVALSLEWIARQKL